ncbi:PQQ-like beta-propeller repeat protein [Natronosalvus caseinilyticus]|uniref:PQQ-like beta-propeller repeat protein n=1 Tax=Natronosalvus caseinilyticus TaxID=2953747 RepID=UPI0028A955C9|nr:PQQ-binding-like beta-propeller repeat protein [Natronosalvus caseinilyticus]
MAGVDIQNTGYHPTATGPTDSVSERWRLQTGGRITGGAAIADGTAYIGSWDSTFYAIDLLEGEIEWSVDRGASNFGETATVLDDKLYVNDGGGDVVAWNKQTGDKIWDSFRDRLAALGSPTVFDGTLYTNTDDGQIVALDCQTGDIEWTHEIRGRGTRTTTVSNGILYAVGVPHYIYAIDLETQERLWETEMDNTMMGFAANEDYLYVGSQGSEAIYAFDLYNGEIIWTCEVSEMVISSTSYHDGSVFATTRNGIACADALDGSLQWETASGGFGGGVSLTDETLYTGSPDGVYAFDNTTGEELWYYETSGNIVSEPALTDGMLFIGTGEGTIYALE